jgi:acid phosphatase (class A)
MSTAARRFLALLLAVAPATFVPLAAQAQTAPQVPAAPRKPADKPVLHYLDPALWLPQRVFAQPPIGKSPEEALELAFVKSEIAGATAERRAQAAADGEHEDPSAFDDTLGRDLKQLPATWDLLVTIQDETDAVIESGKDAFMRLRPYAVEEKLDTCVKVDMAKANRSYPSGHAGMGYAVGWALARLMPTMAPAILARADDYALSRVVCGQHFESDVQASHAAAVLIAETLLADPRLADKVKAARAELGGQ